MNLAEPLITLYQEQRKPINFSAAKMFFKGERAIQHPMPDYIAEQQPFIATALRLQLPVPDCIPDRTGATWGRMRAVCYAGAKRAKFRGSPGSNDAGSSKGAARHWVCQCTCGNYELRTQRTLNRQHPQDQCWECGTQAHALRAPQSP